MKIDPRAFLSDLSSLPDGVVVTDPVTLEGYRRDELKAIEAGTPAAVVFARCTSDVQTVVRGAAAHHISVVARGAGSGLSGGANAIDGCVVVSLERMSSIVAVEPQNLLAVVEPGVLNA
ncbi:MAG: FAD-binding protein, partial [Actinobacteria bacterium]|nr:FAD-binding protein [Actinomycetota bacterium]